MNNSQMVIIFIQDTLLQKSYIKIHTWPVFSFKSNKLNEKEKEKGRTFGITHSSRQPLHYVALLSGFQTS